MQPPLERHQVFSRHDFCGIVSCFAARGQRLQIGNPHQCDFDTHIGHANFLRMSVRDTITQAERDAAHTAAREVIGTATIDAVTPVSGGPTSAWLFRIDAGDENYLLRIESVPSPLRNPYQYVSPGIAAEAGIAPRLYCVNETSQVAVMDFFSRSTPAAKHVLGKMFLASSSRTSQRPASIFRYEPHPGGLNVRVKNTGALAFFNR